MVRQKIYLNDINERRKNRREIGYTFEIRQEGCPYSTTFEGEIFKNPLVSIWILLQQPWNSWRERCVELFSSYVFADLGRVSASCIMNTMGSTTSTRYLVQTTAQYGNTLHGQMAEKGSSGNNNYDVFRLCAYSSRAIRYRVKSENPSLSKTIVRHVQIVRYTRSHCVLLYYIKRQTPERRRQPHSAWQNNNILNRALMVAAEATVYAQGFCSVLIPMGSLYNVQCTGDVPCSCAIVSQANWISKLRHRVRY